MHFCFTISLFQVCIPACVLVLKANQRAKHPKKDNQKKRAKSRLSKEHNQTGPELFRETGAWYQSAWKRHAGKS